MSSSEKSSSRGSGTDGLESASLAQIARLRASLELAVVQIEIIEQQLRAQHFTSPEGLLSLANIARNAAEQAREALDPG